ANLKSINDIRNGIMGTPSLHTPFLGSRCAKGFQTPNRILQTDDVPDRHIRNLPDGASYPFSSRYTLQWLAADDTFLRSFFPNNSDAAFISHHKPKPSDLLLHYNYGAAALKHWGRNHTILNNCPGLARPQAPETVPTKSLTTAQADRIQRQPANNGGSAGSAAATDSEQPAWDEDNVMLFFWGNSPASIERHAMKEQERKENINKWRAAT
ncbi:hypothetical protein L208DRAFT_1270819, partial [Tricholoma matsutake]